MTATRLIAHADMDAFFAAVEQLDRPELRGKPVIVGHPGKRGVVATASYEARPFGVGSAMPMERARRLCPDAVIVPPRFARYQELSARVMEVFDAFSPRVEALSLDEAFLDLTGTERLFGPPAEAGRRLREEVRRATGGLTVSVGLATSKFVAKVASDHRKPDGLTIVPPGDEAAFLAPMPVRRLWGVGPKGAERLLRLGLSTIGEVATADEGWLERRLGSLGPHLRRLARGEDAREVIPEREARSVGSERTLEADVLGAAAIRPLLLRAADEVAARLRRSGLRARGVRVKLKTARFRLQTRQALLDEATDSAGPLHAAALELLEGFELDEPMRLVGLTAYELDDDAAPRQQELFAPPNEARRERLDRVLDAVHERFGRAALRRASQLPEDDAARPPRDPTKPGK